MDKDTLSSAARELGAIGGHNRWRGFTPRERREEMLRVTAARLAKKQDEYLPVADGSEVIEFSRV